MIEAPPKTDYRSLLQGVLERRPDATRETRQTIYQRARQILVVSTCAPRLRRCPRRNWSGKGATSKPQLCSLKLNSMRRTSPSRFPRKSHGPWTLRSNIRERRPFQMRICQCGRCSALPCPAAAKREAVACCVRVACRVKDSRPQLSCCARDGSPSVRGVDPTLPAILEFQRPSTAIVNAPIPRSARLVSWLIASMVIALIAAAGLISVDRVVTAQGVVVSQSPTILVQPLETAIVRSIEVKEGQQVRAGEVLAKLDPTFAAADLGSLTAQVSSLSAEVARLQAEAGEQTFHL